MHERRLVTGGTAPCIVGRMPASASGMQRSHGRTICAWNVHATQVEAAREQLEVASGEAARFAALSCAALRQRSLRQAAAAGSTASSCGTASGDSGGCPLVEAFDMSMVADGCAASCPGIATGNTVVVALAPLEPIAAVHSCPAGAPHEMQTRQGPVTEVRAAAKSAATAVAPPEPQPFAESGSDAASPLPRVPLPDRDEPALG